MRSAGVGLGLSGLVTILVGMSFISLFGATSVVVVSLGGLVFYLGLALIKDAQ